MPIFGLKLSDINIDNIKELINDKERENLYLEYKKKLPNFSNEKEKIEFLYDISAFANANGGDIIYGISEKKDKRNVPTSIPTKIEGIGQNINESAFQLKIEAFSRTLIEPPIIAIMFKLIKYNNNKILVLRVPRSWARPHSVTYNHNIRVYHRTDSGKQPLSFGEVKQMIIESGSMIDKIRQFRLERIEEISNGDLPVRPQPSAVLIHMIPFTAFEKGNIFNAEYIRREMDKCGCSPLGSTGRMKSRYNFDGVLDINSEELGHGLGIINTSYLQIFRNGIVETANNRLIFKEKNFKGEDNVFSSEELEISIINAFKQYLDFQNSIKIQLPIFLFISLIDVKDVIILSNYIGYGSNPEPIDRTNLLIPEIVVENYDEKPEKVLKPAFDAIWNAADMPRSMNYDEDGNYKIKLQ